MQPPLFAVVPEAGASYVSCSVLLRKFVSPAVWCIAALQATASDASARDAEKAPRPNVLIMLSDDK